MHCFSSLRKRFTALVLYIKRDNLFPRASLLSSLIVEETREEKESGPGNEVAKRNAGNHRNPETSVVKFALIQMS